MNLKKRKVSKCLIHVIGEKSQSKNKRNNSNNKSGKSSVKKLNKKRENKYNEKYAVNSDNLEYDDLSKNNDTEANQVSY